MIIPSFDLMIPAEFVLTVYLISLWTCETDYLQDSQYIDIPQETFHLLITFFFSRYFYFNLWHLELLLALSDVFLSLATILLLSWISFHFLPFIPTKGILFYIRVRHAYFFPVLITEIFKRVRILLNLKYILANSVTSCFQFRHCQYFYVLIMIAFYSPSS